MPDIFDASARNQAPADTTQFDAQPDTPSRLAHPDPAQPALAGGTTGEPNNSEYHRLTRHVDDYSDVMRHESPSNNPFKSFVAKPEKIFFDTQHYEERVLLLLRRHPVTQLGWILVVLLLAVVPALFVEIDLLGFLPPNYQAAATIGWYLVLLGFSLQSFLSWFYNVYIVTDERVIDVDFYNLLYKNISSAKIDNIEDITSTTQGILASMFNYGTVKIQTAGTVTEFDFEDVPQPARVAAFLNEMLLEEEREKLENRAT